MPGVLILEALAQTGAVAALSLPENLSLIHICTVNPTGNTVAESWAAVKAGRCAVGPITAFDTTDFKVKLAAEVKDFDPAERIDRREARKMARFTQFAVAAADEAIHDLSLIHIWNRSDYAGSNLQMEHFGL